MSETKKHEVSKFLFDSIPDALSVRISDVITVEFVVNEPVALFSHMHAIAARLCTDDLEVRSGLLFRRGGSVEDGMTLVIRDWCWMEEGYE